MSRTSIDTIFVDLDGVCADLHLALADLFAIRTWPPGEWDLTKITGLSSEALWGDPRVQGAAFWGGLPKTPHADLVVELCEKRADVVFLSGTVRDTGSAAGKHAWVQKHYPKIPLLCGPSWAKRFVAREGACLVDDADRNVEEWLEAGGPAFLYPRPWNRLHDRAHTALEDLDDALASLCAS